MDNKIDKSRKQEIEYVKNMLNDKNILLEGPIGVGKSFVLKETKRKIKKINMAKISKKEFADNNIFRHLFFVGKLKYIWQNFWRIFILWILPLFTGFYTLAGVFSSFIDTKNPVFVYLYWGLLPTILFLLFVLMLIIICVDKQLCSKKRVICFEEINFIEKENNYKSFIFKIIDLLGDKKRYVFESTENIDGSLMLKLNLKKILITTPPSVYYLIKKSLEEVIKSSNDNVGFEKNISEWSDQIDYTTRSIMGIIKDATYREIRDICDNFNDFSKHTKGEILPIEYFTIKYISNIDKKTIDELIEILKVYNLINDRHKKIDGEQESQYQNKRKELIEGANVRVRECLENFIPTYRLLKDRINKHFSFFNPSFQPYYLSAVTFTFLEADVIYALHKGLEWFIDKYKEEGINIYWVNIRVQRNINILKNAYF